MNTLVLKVPSKRAEKLELVEALIIQNEMVLTLMKFSGSDDLQKDFSKTAKEIDGLLAEVAEMDKKHELLSKNIFLS